MFTELIKSLSAYGPAWRAMSKYKLWKYVWISGIISVALTGLVVGFALSYADDLGRFFAERYPWEWGATLVEGLGTFLAAFLMLILVAFVFKYVVMVLVAPFMGLLSEELEHNLTGVAPPKFDGLQLFKDMFRGLRIALRNILREILYTLLVTLAGFIVPVIGNFLATAVTILIQSYFAGFGNMDYTLERKRFSVKESVAFVGANRGLAMGNGLGFLALFFFVPVLGWFLAPSLGTAAATLRTLKQLDPKMSYQEKLSA